LKVFCFAAPAIAGVLSSLAIGDTIQVNGLVSASTEGLGRFVATLDYAVLPSGDGQLSVTLENKSDADDGGFLTGFLFDVGFPSADVVVALQPGASHPFADASGSAPPFGSYDAGAALGGNWAGGGSPNAGIPTGASGTFVFLVIGEQAGSLTAADFIKSDNEYGFVVRFKGFENGGSDKVPGVSGCFCDLNVDGVVDMGDLGIVLSAWGPLQPNAVADFNADGGVDGADLGLFLECWRDCAFQ
jgi:hypothetical protein